ncbi:MAG TPA: outer membrane protein assembly factor BamA [Vicinamibacterales bacterium]|nr:outer membrane protein assembly factor BamA [Vicinamibacterales bacterium]
MIKALRTSAGGAPLSQALTASASQPPAQQAAPAPILPPEGSPPLLRTIRIEFPTQGNASVIDPQTYLYYIQTRPSRPSDGVWVPWDEAAEKSVLEDFKRLWGTNFLDNLWIEVRDAPYANGVMGKEVWFNMEERQRVKIVDYTGSKKIEQSKIEEKLREESVSIRLDSFIDPALIRRVEGIIRGMFAEKGYEFASVSHTISEVAGGPKLVNLTFNLDEGPKVKVRNIDFIGNKAASDGKLERQMKSNKSEKMWSWITGGGTYQAGKFEEDADAILEHYRNEGYVMARVGQPELRYVDDSADRKTRYVELRVPVTEGERYRVGDFTFDGNTVIKSEGLQGVFRVKPGSYYSEKKIRKSLEKAREVYGSLGYYEFTAYPDIKPREPASEEEQALAPKAPEPPTIDVTMRVQEGKQYFVNRITFAGNTTTRDNVIRREIRLFEGGVFNTEALKFSIKRLNQLGYFKQLEGAGKELQIDKTPGSDNQVDVKIKFEEQNRNQLTFGAGVSQYEGFFGQLSFQTANFMGRGETFTVSLQQGSRARNYQVGFSEPFLFDRPITLGTELHRQQIRYPYTYTQNNTGGSLTFGFAVRSFSRVFTTYSYDAITIADLNQAFLGPPTITPENPQYVVPPLGFEPSNPSTPGTGNPFYDDMLLLGSGGKRTVSKITPSFVHNTVDNPIFPSAGRRLTASVDLAGPGGNTRFIKPTLEGVYYRPLTRRMTVGARGQFIYVTPMGDGTILPIFERLFLGGEYSVRGFDIRTIGPRDPLTGYVIGGNTSILFNAEYLIQIAGPVRLVFFYDAGQVLVKQQNPSFDKFKTSTGAEIRFFMPVLNVPFRLIAAWNPQRDGVFDNQLQPQKAFTFRFAVGSTF